MKLSELHSPVDLKPLDDIALNDLARQMRQAMLQRLSAIGGHVGPNLGVVEPMLAIHKVFDAPADKIVIDVSHQDYVHKMVTGRSYGFLDPSRYDEVGEFTDPEESPDYDIFYAGHTSPSITLALGMAKARDLLGQRHNVVAFIGDGSLSGGVAFEGLDAAAELRSNFIIVVNDNQMAIAENHGGIYDNLAELRETGGTSEHNMFRDLGLDYRYVAEGNNVTACREALEAVKDIDHPVVVHINTQKGQGYAPAERDREGFHSPGPFVLATGQMADLDNSIDYSDITRDYLIDKIAADPSVLVISSATPELFGFLEPERKKAGRQYLDVGIAEQAGVSVASGAARGGLKSIYCVMASFLQRAYDQLVQDLSLDGAPAVIPVMLSGLLAMNDVTHLGFWDIPMLTSIPGLLYLTPANVEEYKAMMDWAVDYTAGAVAVRVPTGAVTHADYPVDTDYSHPAYKVTRRGSRIAVIAVGDFYARGAETVRILSNNGIEASLVNPLQVSVLDTAALDALARDHSVIVTLENGQTDGGFGQRVAAYYGTAPVKVLVRGGRKEFVNRYNRAELLNRWRLDPDQIAADAVAAFG